MTVTPHNLIYLQINCVEINKLSIWTIDQNADLMSLSGENVSIRKHIYLIERFFILKDLVFILRRAKL